jgi:protein required for attachment to host cells
MHVEVRDRLIAEIDKTLTNHPLREIEQIVTDTLEKMDDRDAA